MSYQALARTWRPRSFTDMVGQEHVVKALSNALDGGRVHHAYLFTGTRGVGKTTVARILAKCLNCEQGVSASPCGTCSACTEIDTGRHLDLIEVDAASRAKVDETRDLMSNVQYAPTRAQHKIYLIDEVHMFSQASFNALLKTLEEPPPHVKFLLATTDPQKMPVTVLSRCLQFSLKRLSREQITGRLESILVAENITAGIDALRLLAKAADGSLRDALSLLDQAIAHGGGEVQEAGVRNMLGLLERRHINNLIAALADADGKAVLAHVEAMAGDVADFADVLAELLAELKHIAVVQMVPDAVEDDEQATLQQRHEFAAGIAPEDIQLFYQIGLIGRRDLPLAPDPRTGFEMTLLRMLAFTPDTAGGVSTTATGTRRSGAAVPVPPAAGAADPGNPPVKRDTAPHTTVNSPDNSPEGEGVDTAVALSWEAMVPALGLAGLARELAVNCELETLEGAVINLRLAPEHQALAAERCRQKLQKALNDYYGRAMRMSINIGDLKSESPAAIGQRRERQRQAQAIEEIEADPAVLDIIETFDAHIDTSSIRPLD